MTTEIVNRRSLSLLHERPVSTQPLQKALQNILAMFPLWDHKDIVKNVNIVKNTRTFLQAP